MENINKSLSATSSDTLQSFKEWDQTFPSNSSATARQVLEKKMHTLVADCLKYLENIRGVFEDGMETSNDEQDIRFQKRRYLNFKRIFTKSYFRPFKVHIFSLKQKLRRKPVNIKLISDRFVDLFQINEKGLDLYCNHVSTLSIYPSMDKFEMLIDQICTLCDMFVNCRTTLESSYSSEMFKLINQLKVSCQSTVRRCRLKLVHRTQSHITLELGKTLSKIESSEFSRASLDEYITKERREAQKKERKHIEIKYSMYTSHNARSKYSSVKSRYKNTAEKKIDVETETILKLNLTNVSSSGSSCSKETAIASRQIEDDIETMIDFNDVCSHEDELDEQPNSIHETFRKTILETVLQPKSPNSVYEGCLDDYENSISPRLINRNIYNNKQVEQNLQDFLCIEKQNKLETKLPKLSRQITVPVIKYKYDYKAVVKENRKAWPLAKGCCDKLLSKMVATIIADPKMEKVLQKTRFPENMHPCLKFKNISSDLDNTAGNDNTSEVISVSIQKKL